MNTHSHIQSSIDRCGIVDLPRHTDPNGQLTEVENTRGGKFHIKRVFYLYDVPANSERGGHSHYQAEELIVAVSGSFNVTLHDGITAKTYTLDRPYKALYIENGVWRTLDSFSAGAVCLVLTTEKYDESDYVRDFEEFLRLTAPKKKTLRYPFLDLAKVNAPYIVEIKEAALRVIDSGRYIGGNEVEQFEQKLISLTKAPYAVGVSNGLDALRLIFKAYIQLGRLDEGDEVIVPANTYIASVLAVTDCGLKPVFVEPSNDTLNLDSQLLEAAITPRTRAIMPVHLYGRVCFDNTLKDIAQKHNLLVIEDNAQAIGAKSRVGGLFGSDMTGALGHAGAFSFYPTKNIGAIGDAGAVVTHDRQLADAVRTLANYGSDRRYHNIYPGYNCRLDPIQAAILSVKLDHINEENTHRKCIAALYNSEITNPKVKLPEYTEDNVWHQYVVLVDNRDEFRKYMADNGVGTDVHYATPPHRQPCYSDYAALDLPVTDYLADRVVSLPISTCTSQADAHEIAAIINAY